MNLKEIFSKHDVKATITGIKLGETGKFEIGFPSGQHLKLHLPAVHCDDHNVTLSEVSTDTEGNFTFTASVGPNDPAKSFNITITGIQSEDTPWHTLSETFNVPILPPSPQATPVFTLTQVGEPAQ
jgi:hypothetical protein